jgi:uncharacterized membrane protein YeaQ/YmgE (transglycosylase-associated protein family)
MMMVETVIRPSAIHGMGVFLTEPVKKGGLIWRFDSRVDRLYSPEEIASLPGHVQRYLRTYSTWNAEVGVYVLCGDNGRYFNHSASPSTISNAIAFGEDHAARDLAAGEELTSDYTTICDEVRANGLDFAGPPTNGHDREGAFAGSDRTKAKLRGYDLQTGALLFATAQADQETNMSLETLVIWLVIGAVAGWLAGLIVKGYGFGIVGNIVVGIVGSLIGGFLFGQLGLFHGSGYLGAIIGATIGAVILLLLIRFIRRAT